MFESQQFQQLISAGRPTGEVVAVQRFLVTVRGLSGVPVGAVILFENGQRGIVRSVNEQSVLILNMDAEDIPIGSVATLLQDKLQVAVGPQLVGRVLSALGEPLDGKPAPVLEQWQPVFGRAPGITERSLLNKQLVTGVSAVDLMFPIVLGQRIAVLGDAKSGKSALMTQLTLNQKGTGNIVVYCLISKRKVDIDNLISKLHETGAIKHSIVVIANVFDSLVQSYLAPYVACAIGEYLWHSGKDTVLIYDDLSSHAKIYRELSLLAKVNPGRDSYPGDMFYAHSSLLERAGKLAASGKTLTALPVVVTPSDDITAYLPTNIMSITDGQIILDLESFRQGIRPAVNVGLSVSRVGGRAQSNRQQALTQTLFRKLADWRQAAEFAHFGSELALESQSDLELGKHIYEAFRQHPDELYTLQEQQLVLETILKTEGKTRVNVESLKRQAKELAGKIKSEDDYLSVIDRLLSENTIQARSTEKAARGQG